MILLLVLAALGLLCVGCILHQLVRGFEKTNLNHQYFWGLYIQGFFFLVSAGAGILLALSALQLTGAELPAHFVDLGNVLGFALLVGGMVILALDLGKPFRVFYMITSKNFASPLIWDFYTLGLTVVLSFLYFFRFLNGSAVLTGVWAFVMLIAAGLCVLVHAMFFLTRVKGGNQADIFLALDTVLFSLAGGVSLLVLMGRYLGLQAAVLPNCLFVLVTLLLVSSIGHRISPLRAKKDGLLALCTALKVLILILLAAGLWGGVQTVPEVAAAVLTVILVFLEKYHLVQSSQHEYVIPGPEAQYQERLTYHPSVKEWLIFIGGIAICLLLWVGICALKGIWPWML